LLRPDLGPGSFGVAASENELMSRTDCYHDPQVTVPNSVVAAASAFVRDAAGRVLLIRRSDNGLWALPGGALEIGETVADW
jgi:hypothetical protein